MAPAGWNSARPRLFAAALGVVAAIGLVDSRLARPANPGRNGLIAFNRQVGDETDVAVVAPDRTGLRVLIRDAYGPAWSPDGLLLAFTRRSRGDSDLWIANADGSGQHELASPDMNEAAASWSPDGRRLVFEAWAHGQQTDELYIENTDGSGRTQLTHENRASRMESPGTPKWSPTGDKIVFEEAGELVLIQPDGQGASSLDDDGTAINPDWSPDGTQVAFDADGRGNRFGSWDDIYTTGINENSRPRDITNTIDYDGNPAWSPDGSTIAYTLWTTHNHVATGQGDLYLMPAGGGPRRPLVRGAASKWGADWQPTPG